MGPRCVEEEVVRECKTKTRTRRPKTMTEPLIPNPKDRQHSTTQHNTAKHKTRQGHEDKTRQGKNKTRHDKQDTTRDDKRNKIGL